MRLKLASCLQYYSRKGVVCIFFIFQFFIISIAFGANLAVKYQEKDFLLTMPTLIHFNGSTFWSLDYEDPDNSDKIISRYVSTDTWQVLATKNLPGTQISVSSEQLTTLNSGIYRIIKDSSGNAIGIYKLQDLDSDWQYFSDLPVACQFNNYCNVELASASFDGKEYLIVNLLMNDTSSLYYSNITDASPNQLTWVNMPGDGYSLIGDQDNFININPLSAYNNVMHIYRNNDSNQDFCEENDPNEYDWDFDHISFGATGFFEHQHVALNNFETLLGAFPNANGEQVAIVANHYPFLCEGSSYRFANVSIKLRDNIGNWSDVSPNYSFLKNSIAKLKNDHIWAANAYLVGENTLNYQFNALDRKARELITYVISDLSTDVEPVPTRTSLPTVQLDDGAISNYEDRVVSYEYKTYTVTMVYPLLIAPNAYVIISELES